VLAGRRIVLGITGGVAAYKAAYLARRLIERGAEVRVVMTESATRFIGEATLAAITGHHPVTQLFDDENVSPHTHLAAWADLVVVAPMTAASISRIATGESSNALTATLLATTAPVVIAPAMHTEMWEHEATKTNLRILIDRGYTVVEPAEGELAGGDIGVGRLREPEEIVEAIESVLGSGPMSGLTVLVTAGGTREALDPVRFIGNRSSGRMGNAVARAAAARGAFVTLVTTAGHLDVSGVNTIEVETADEMAEAAWAIAPQCDIAVMAAAVADFKPSKPADNKIKRADGIPAIELIPTPDVLRGVHESDPRPFLVGFAAETGSIDDAHSKAVRKGVDLLVANDVSKDGSGFGSETNEVTLIRSDGTTRGLPLMSKDDVAAALWDEVAALRRV
jgi:phosphopantothenoylcysteine decarboxylase / phosphopantothenate---cysteine ligase